MPSTRTRAFHEDSDADDEFERRSFTTSPDRSRSNSDTSSIRSAQHTPTLEVHGEDHASPGVITAWTSEDCVHFLNELGLNQYSEAILEQGIDGETLIALNHDELREMGVVSAGHRLRILRAIYNIKTELGLTIQPDDFVPKSVQQEEQNTSATKEDISRLTQAILKLRDERIQELEAQVTKLADEARKLRTELWPIFRMVKENQPLPYRPSHDTAVPGADYTIDPVMSPPPPPPPPLTASLVENKEAKSSLSRSFSKRLGLTSGNKILSPTHIPETVPERREPIGLQPSAAANAASNSLTAQMTGGPPSSTFAPTSNGTTQSPTSPFNYHQPHSSRSTATMFDRETTGNDILRTGSVPPPGMMSLGNSSVFHNIHSVNPPKSATSHKYSIDSTSSSSTLVPSRETSASVPPHLLTRSTSSDSTVTFNNPPHSRAEKDATSVEIFKSFRVALDDPCHKVLPAALRKYNINADWRQYALYIVYGDQERCVGLEEKPLALFKELDREGKKPMFMLRKWAGGPPASGFLEPSSGGGLKSATLLPSMGTSRTPAGGIVPGGLL